MGLSDYYIYTGDLEYIRQNYVLGKILDYWGGMLDLGASPIYLQGRYFLGVCPTAPGYETFEIKPALGGLDWMEGVVPTPNGKIEVYMDQVE